MDFPIKNGGSFHSYVSLPEGIGLNPAFVEPVCRGTMPISEPIIVTHIYSLIVTGTGCDRRPMCNITTLLLLLFVITKRERDIYIYIYVYVRQHPVNLCEFTTGMLRCLILRNIPLS